MDAPVYQKTENRKQKTGPHAEDYGERRKHRNLALAMPLRLSGTPLQPAIGPWYDPHRLPTVCRAQYTFVCRKLQGLKRGDRGFFHMFCQE